MSSQIKKSILWGFAGMAGLLIFYFVVLDLISGWNFTRTQFDDNWYWVLGLSAGFGIQIGIFAYLRAMRQSRVSAKITAASGATSTIAMISCCAHYFVNILPFLGISGLAMIIGQYQTELFIVSLISNLLGIAYLAMKFYKLRLLETKI